MQKIKIHYIYHSSFLIEIGEYALLFDFYNNSKESWEYVEKIFDRVKKILIFSSHSHKDHFSREIFKWREKYSDINFIVSSDIQIGEADERIHKLFTNHELRLEYAEIHAFGSTDLGVSYLVSIYGKNIFHAGDFNWWDWGREDTESEAKEMEKRFKRILRDIELSRKKIDIAFFPIDPRLEERAGKGIIYFLENLDVKYIIPMHLWDRYEIINRFDENNRLLLREKNIKVLKFSKPNQELDLS